MLRPSCTAPWLVAPSPSATTLTRPAASSSALSAAPQAIGTPAPTIEFSPTKFTLAALKYGDAPRPPLSPDWRPSTSANSAVGVTPATSAHPCPR